MITIAATQETPDGWLLVPLPEICQINPPKPAQDALPPDGPVTFVPMPAVDADSGTIATPMIRPFAEVRKGFTAFRDYDVIMAKITPCMENGKAAIARNLENGFGFGSTEFHVFRSSPAILPEFVFYFIRQESFRRSAADEMTGSVGQKRVPAEFLKRTGIPLPPLAEQKRMVAKVETLLARVNAARQRLAKVPALLKRFRQSVLAAACSGQLTEDWRTKNGHHDATADFQSIGTKPANESTKAEATEGHEAIANAVPPSWTLPCLESLFRFIDYRGKNPQKAASGKRLITAKNISMGYISDEPIEFVSDATYVAWMTRGFPKKGDIFFVTEGATMGFVALNDREGEIALAQRTLTLQPFQTLGTKFFYYFMMSKFFQDLVVLNATGSAAVGIKAARVRDLPAPFPPLAEQHEIVRRVEALLARADRIEKRLATATRRVETLTQAILAQAFRGELVPTEAELARQEGRDYEPAAALLERIRADRAKEMKDHELTKKRETRSKRP